MFTQVDKDKTSTLSAAEVDDILASLPNPSGKTAAQMVKALDSNGDGSLSVAEFTDGVQLNEKVSNALLAAQDITSGSAMLSILSGSGDSSGGNDLFAALSGNTGSGDTSSTDSYTALLEQIVNQYKETATDSTTNGTVSTDTAA